MRKFDVGFKRKVVRDYLSGKGGYKILAARYDIADSLVRNWIMAYKHHGSAGLVRRHARYTYEFKLEVLHRRAAENLSYRKLAAIYNIGNPHSITMWQKQYECGKLRSPQCISLLDNSLVTKKKTLPKSPEAEQSEQADGLLRENQRLRAEVAYLKKISALVLAKIEAVYVKHRGLYGYRRVTAAIRRDGWRVNHKTVQRLMSEMGMKSRIRAKKFRSYKSELGKAAPNSLNREFTAAQANQKWVTDVTEFRVAGKKLYLSPVMDLYNGEIIAYETSHRSDFSLVINMLKRAARKCRRMAGPLLHSDQGWHYRMKPYRAALARYGMKQSMSRKGNCFDNAAIESFFGTLKAEFFRLTKIDSIAQLETGLRDYIHYYNHERIKLKLNAMSPVEYRLCNTAILERA